MSATDIINKSKGTPNKKEYVTTLMFPEFPVFTVYTDGDKNIIITIWVDCVDDIDICFTFNTDKENLKDYIKFNITYTTFIQNALDNKYYWEVCGEKTLISKTSFSEITKTYFINKLYFQEDLSDLEAINKLYRVFNL